MIGEVALGQAYGPLVESIIGVLATLARNQPGDHPVDPLALLGPRELGRDKHHHSLAVAVRGDRTASAGTAPYLDGQAPDVSTDTVAVIGN